MNLQDKVIAVTGAARGLGAAISETLAAKGAHVVLLDVQQTILDEKVAQLKQQGLTVSGHLIDVADEMSVIEVFNGIKSELGQLNGLVNNAGILRDALLIKAKNGEVIDEMSLSAWQQVIDVNLTGVFLCGRAAARTMIETDSEGVIVNISSISRKGNMGQSNYAAAKAGVEALTNTWAKELARFQIRAATIAPGFIETEMTGSMRPDMIEKLASRIPLKRLGKPANIAETVQFIFENDYLSGKTLEIDGALSF